MSVYLDASVLLPIFIEEVHSSRAEALLLRGPLSRLISDFAAAEFAAAVGRRVRMGEIATADVAAAFDAFDTWRTAATLNIATTSEDIARASSFLRRLDLNLRTPDAIHIAIASRLTAELATFDRKMAANALALGVRLAAT